MTITSLLLLLATVMLPAFLFQGSNEENKVLNEHINEVDRRIHLVPSQVSDFSF